MEETSTSLMSRLHKGGSRADWDRLVVVDGKTVAEVAAELAITQNAVYIARHRVLSRLKAELTEFVD